jgi:hypothetical protein
MDDAGVRRTGIDEARRAAAADPPPSAIAPRPLRDPT